MNEFVVYVLYSSKYDAIYIGYTSSLIQRFYSHNYFSKKGYTTKYRPWTVIYNEFYSLKSEVIKREKELKSYQGRKWIREYIYENYNL